MYPSSLSKKGHRKVGFHAVIPVSLNFVIFCPLILLQEYLLIVMFVIYQNIHLQVILILV